MFRAKIILGLLILCFFYDSRAQIDSIDVINLSREQVLNLSNDELRSLSIEDLIYLSGKLGLNIDELLNQQVTVGSKKQLTPRESPGIISIISRDEIIKSGARDLIDVLNLVPGIDFGYDLDGVIGLGMRGNWALEGKVLVMIDGLEINEGMYTTVNFGNHFSPEQIQRIEIIRGPGSSLYGGYAELGVINIITRSASDLKGINVYTSAGAMKDAIGNETIGIQAGGIAGKTELSLLGNFSTGNRSDITYTDFEGENWNMKGGYSKYQTSNLNVALKNRGLACRFIADDYSTRITGYAEGATNSFTSLLSTVSYQFKLPRNIEITPAVYYRWQLPYHLIDTAWVYDRSFNRLTANVNVLYDITSKINLTGGAEYYYDRAIDRTNDSVSVFNNGLKEINYFNYSAYLQGMIKLGYFNLFGGGRVDHHNQAGTNFSPRAGITAVVTNFHFKILYSNAFRTPSIENLNLNSEILPEKTNVFELETGYKLTNKMFVTANFYDITIKDPIVYRYYPDTEEETYLNYNKTGSKGFELQYTLQNNHLFCNLSYSYYNSSNKNNVDLYEVQLSDGSINEKLLQAFAGHKIGLNARVTLFTYLTIAPTLVYYHAKYGFIDNDANQSKDQPKTIMNLFVNYDKLFVEGLSVGAGVYNILDTDVQYIQPYGSAGNSLKPYPGSSREFLIKLAYYFQFKKK